MGGFLDYIPGDTFLHRLNPVTKLVLAFLLCAACFCAGSIPFVLGVIALNLLLAASAGALPRALRLLLALAKLALMFFVIQLLFVQEGRALVNLPLGLMITDKGLAFSTLLALRLIGATLPLALMLSVTQMSDLTGALVQQLHIPYRYAFALMTAIRFIPTFNREMKDIMEAQTARGVAFDTKNFFKKVGLLLPLCVPLLVSSVGRINQGAIAVELKGFNRRRRTSGYKRYAFRLWDAAAAGSAAALVVLAAVL
ncbi:MULTISPECIES: energy-coupling factor transporter transmembrane component T [unclassified Clostridium]|uniref:energy-coupling factor transporter transmembrane component T family protein n=1 Tax=unclassified Clostridium TaxID=2614128 RepID=UPI0011071AC0|nr:MULTISPECIES: energy-coupling factor transporter transmembrane component T [unclassified Clostridium]